MGKCAYLHPQGLIGVLACARDLAEAHNLSAPLLLITDNTLLREEVAAGYFARVVGPQVWGGVVRV